eukprot:g25638.t1
MGQMLANGTRLVWSLLDKGKLVDSMEGMGVPITLLSVSGDTLISASRSAYYLKIWSLAYDRQRKTIAPFHNRTAIAGVSEDGKFVCFPKTGDLEKTVIWNPEEGLRRHHRKVPTEQALFLDNNKVRYMRTGNMNLHSKVSLFGNTPQDLTIKC